MESQHPYSKIDDPLMILAVSVVMFFLTLSALSSIGFVPSYIDGIYPSQENASLSDAEVLPNANGQLHLKDLPQLGGPSTLSELARNDTSSIAGVNPERIVIHSIGVDLPVLNPEETTVSALDNSLLSGVVRYPLSVKLNEDGNVFIFGHSSHVAIVHNRMFKAFNGIGDLREGDSIKVVGGDMAYIYRVTSVRIADADEELINLSAKSERKLTLSTCDSFGGKSSRFIVESEFIGAYKNE